MEDLNELNKGNLKEFSLYEDEADNNSVCTIGNNVFFNGVNYDFDRKLSMVEYIAIVDTIVDSCFDVVEYKYDDNGMVIAIDEEEYKPTYKYIQTQMVLSSFFTDIKLDYATDELEKYDLVSNVDINIIASYCCQVRDLLRVIDEKIDIRRKQIKNKHNKNNTVTELVEELVRLRLDNEKAQSKSLDIVNNFSQEDLTSFIGGIGKIGELTSNEDIVKEITKLIHKDNKKKTPQDHKKTNEI